MTTPSTPYRTEIDALRERKAALEDELARVREQASRLESLRAEESDLANELARVEARLREGGGATKRALPTLDQLKVASPCSADWNEMVGDDRVRFCLSCEKNVYNLSAMRRDEAEALLAERLEGEICVRFFQRADGTVMTQDCPVGVKKKRRKMFALAVAGAGAMTAAAAAALAKPEAEARELAERHVQRSFHVEAPPVQPHTIQGQMRMGGVGARTTPPPVHEIKGRRAR
jgi:hypothetical protein